MSNSANFYIASVIIAVITGVDRVAILVLTASYKIVIVTAMFIVNSFKIRILVTS